MVHAERLDKPALNGAVLAMIINSINGLNNVEIRENDVHGMAANEKLLPSIWHKHFFLATIHSPREVKLYRI